MTNHTPGPWRWEVNEKHKSMQLVGGRPKFDLTIMDFERWGMSGAVANLRDPSVDGMNVMRRSTDWAVPVAGREHHASWLKTIEHPDARLIAAAPELLETLESFPGFLCGTESGDAWIEQMRTAIAKARGEA